KISNYQLPIHLLNLLLLSFGRIFGKVYLDSENKVVRSPFKVRITLLPYQKYIVTLEKHSLEKL
ncbi:hypothetical protein, partial [Fischerella thermalis]|uniref:hypothetical protein n=1 Tax=Fischerella thermalis TaxID=372787 RepID=UPI001CA4852A